MKKLFLLFCLSISLFTSPAFAVTENSYLSLDLVGSFGSFDERFKEQAYPNGYITKPSHKNVGYGAGFTYVYALNYEGFFIAPGVFAEYNNLRINSKKEDAGRNAPQKLEIKTRFGAKTNIGYDVTDDFAIYATGGYSGVYYNTSNYNSSIQLPNRTLGGVAGDWFYGGGLKLDLTEEFSIFGEYTSQKFSAKTKIPNNTISYRGTYTARLNVAKVGLAYRF